MNMSPGRTPSLARQKRSFRKLLPVSGSLSNYGTGVWILWPQDNHISIQAKRYAIGNNVQRHEVQSFVGAVAGTTSKKGVFITTSDYTKGAMEYVESLNGSPTIILINGHQLAEYSYDYGLGLQTEKFLKSWKWIWTTGMQWIMDNIMFISSTQNDILWDNLLIYSYILLWANCWRDKLGTKYCVPKERKTIRLIEIRDVESYETFFVSRFSFACPRFVPCIGSLVLQHF